MYYGNSGASSISDVDATFTFGYDPRDEDLSSKFDEVSAGGTLTETGEVLEIYDPGTGVNEQIQTKSAIDLEDTIIMCKWFADEYPVHGTYDPWGWILTVPVWNTGDYFAFYQPNFFPFDIAYRKDGSGTITVESDVYDKSVEYLLECGLTSSNAVYFKDSVEKFDVAHSLSGGLTQKFTVVVDGSGSVDTGNLFTLEYVCVRNWIENEPVQGVWGDEEQIGFIGSVSLEADSTFYPLQYGFVNASVYGDPNATVYINVTVTVETAVLLWDNNTNVFSVHADPDGLVELDASGCSILDQNLTHFYLSWRVAFTWDLSEGNHNGTGNGFVSESGYVGNTITSNLFYFENDVQVSSVSNDDNDGSRVNPSQSVTWTGQTYWNGTSVDPYPDVGSDLCNVTLELAGVALTSVQISSGGVYSISYNANSSVALYNYTVYAVTPASEISVSNQTDQLIVDEFLVGTWMADDYDVPVDTQVNFTIANFTSAYDGSELPGLDFLIQRNSTDWEPAKTANFSDVQTDPGYYVYTLGLVSNNYNLTDFVEDPGNLVVAWWTVEPGGDGDYTDAGDLAEWAVASLIFIPITILFLAVLLKRR
jgi:hypothetical protein